MMRRIFPLLNNRGTQKTFGGSRWIRLHFLWPTICIGLLLASCEPQPQDAHVSDTRLPEEETTALEESPEKPRPAPQALDSAAYEWKDGYIQLDWKDLSRVEFEERMMPNPEKKQGESRASTDYIGLPEDDSVFVLFPVFHDSIKMLEGKPVEISGFFIDLPTEKSGKLHFISAYPMSQCFFCGASGPETVMDVMTEKAYRHLRTDDVVTFRGRLHLNDQDLNHMNYILKAAEMTDHKPKAKG